MDWDIAIMRSWHVLLLVLTTPIIMGAANSPPPAQSFTFGTGEIQFPSGGFTFSEAAFDFPNRLDRTETAATIEFVLPAEVLFDFDKADIRPEASATLDELARLIKESARGPVTIHGFTDALGKADYNQKLSERRASSVKAWLISRGGIASRNISTQGFGARNPVAQNRHPDGSDDPEGRQRNRRVSVTIRK
jgi:outer membrane protein OmpA-like peptidoglycan-associated protein